MLKLLPVTRDKVNNPSIPTGAGVNTNESHKEVQAHFSNRRAFAEKISSLPSDCG
ncbi:hypothetical protein [Pragia fontium]|uniref:hypothetical protein n=1 Tax=Pragia fontium TaxID=82985 RepID=UPI00130EA699|nr:hypothetical protein [Pragia fontium]